VPRRAVFTDRALLLTQLGLLLWWAVDDNARPYLVDQQTILYVSAGEAICLSGVANSRLAAISTDQ
jgi:hypothetical protein